MTREEKIKAFGKAQEEAKKQAELDEMDKRDNLIFKVVDYQERVNKLIDLAVLCKENNVNLGEKQDSLRSKGIESNCFISNGWSHRFGFNRSLDALGFYNGGACGSTDMWLYRDGKLVYPTGEYHFYADGLTKWLKLFDKFETAFLKYIDELM